MRLCCLSFGETSIFHDFIYIDCRAKFVQKKNAILIIGNCRESFTFFHVIGGSPDLVHLIGVEVGPREVSDIKIIIADIAL
jgi:hypothetical protein